MGSIPASRTRISVLENSSEAQAPGLFFFAGGLLGDSRPRFAPLVSGLEGLSDPRTGVAVTQVVGDAKAELPIGAVRPLGDVASQDGNGFAETDDQGRGPGRPSARKYHTESAVCIALSTFLNHPSR